MATWYMLTVIGQDRIGIVAKITTTLYQQGCNLGEASMLRLGGNFTIMLMVKSEQSMSQIEQGLQTIINELELNLHLTQIDANLHQHHLPNIKITVSGEDHLGIVAQVTSLLADHQVNIVDLESDVAGTENSPIYIMRIDGIAKGDYAKLQQALNKLQSQGIIAKVQAIDTLIG